MKFVLLNGQLKSILPACSLIQKDELFSSWLVRLAHDHYLKSHIFCKLVFPNIAVWNRDIDRNANDEIINIIASRVLNSKIEILNSLLVSYEGVLFERHNKLGLTRWILPLGICHRKRTRNGLLFCPNCLANDENYPYFRKKWRLSFSVVCPDCNYQLIDCCPQCFSPIVFFRTGLGNKDNNIIRPITNCYNCDFDLRNSKKTKASDELVNMQLYLYDVLNSKDGYFLYPFQYFNVLYQLTKIINGEKIFSKNIRDDLFSLTSMQYNSDSKGIPFDFLNLQQRIPILYYSYWLLKEWPQRFVLFSKQHHLWSATLFKELNNPPYWFRDVVISNLFVSNTNRCFGDFKVIFQNSNLIL